MGWIKKLEKNPKSHECHTPNAQKVKAGSTWRCDSCSQGWIVVESTLIQVTTGLWSTKTEMLHSWEHATTEQLYPPPDRSRASSSDAGRDVLPSMITDNPKRK